MTHTITPESAASGPNATVAVVGSINVDILARTHSHPRPGETVLGTSVKPSAGGKGANQAVAAALQGAAVSMIGAVGNDGFQQDALRQLRAAGVDLSRVEEVEAATGLALITVSDAGENSIVVVPGANAYVTPAIVQRHQDLIAESPIVVLQGEIPRSAIEAVAQVARGRLIVNLAPAIEVLPEVILASDPLVVNEHEAAASALILGIDTLPQAQDDAAATLVERGVKSVVTTLGSRGALVAQRNMDGHVEVQHFDAPKVTAVDTTGAGDAFTGALAARLAVGSSLIDAAATAVQVGAYTVQRHGAQVSYPSLNDELPG